MAESKCIQKYKKRKRKSRWKRGRGSEHGFNEAKYLIFSMLSKSHNSESHNYLTPRDIAKECGITLASVKVLLGRYHKMGYIFRRREFREGKRNIFCYKHFKPKGHRTYAEMAKRVGIRERSGIFVSLNRKKLVPPEAKSACERIGSTVIDDRSMTGRLTASKNLAETGSRGELSHSGEHEEDWRDVR